MAKRLLALLTALLMVMLASLAAAEGDTTTYKSDFGYSITVPADWVYFDQEALRDYVLQNKDEVASSIGLDEEYIDLYEANQVEAEMYSSPDFLAAVQVQVNDATGFSMKLLKLIKSALKPIISEMSTGEVVAEEMVTVGEQDFYHVTIASSEGEKMEMYLTIANDLMFSIAAAGMDEKTAESILSSFSSTPSE